MKKPFKDPIEDKNRTSSYDFVAPTKEQATTGRFMCAGDGHGVGHRTPVGTEKVSGMKSGPIPQKAFCTDPEEII
jgi:hypothetical protein